MSEREKPYPLNRNLSRAQLAEQPVEIKPWYKSSIFITLVYILAINVIAVIVITVIVNFIMPGKQFMDVEVVKQDNVTMGNDTATTSIP